MDVETTGFGKNDRIIELALIGLDQFGDKQWEWCSLVNPERDTGSGRAVKIHQIYTRDVENVPTFRDFSGHIAKLLNGKILICHNAAFDLRMLSTEYSRLGIVTPNIEHICTLKVARSMGICPANLENCCNVLGVVMEGMHHALADARATYYVAKEMGVFTGQYIDEISHVNIWPSLELVKTQPKTRPIYPSYQPLKKTVIKQSIPKNTITEIKEYSIEYGTPQSKYLHVVEWVLEDRDITPEQKSILVNHQNELGLTDDQVRDINLTFLQGLTGSMLDNGLITSYEKFDLDRIINLLGLSDIDLQYAIDNPIGLNLINENYRLSSGQRVVFTGEMSLSRSVWKQRAVDAGLRVTGSVSGKTNFLVVPFGETGSSKSRKAREIGVRVVTEQRFIRMIKRLELKKELN
jgi:DNA polymerase-3 subunit epsilon